MKTDSDEDSKNLKGYIYVAEIQHKKKRGQMKKLEPRSTSSCAACKLLKRRCTSNCQFAPYFRSNDQKRFAKVHKVFGASNVSKILKQVTEELREDTVNSLVYEAEVRLKDPVYGCIGAIISLQKKMEQLQHDLFLAKTRLAFSAASASAVANCNNSVSSYENQDFNGTVCIDEMLSYTTGLPLEQQPCIDENCWFI